MRNSIGYVFLMSLTVAGCLTPVNLNPRTVGLDHRSASYLEDADGNPVAWNGRPVELDHVSGGGAVTEEGYARILVADGERKVLAGEGRMYVGIGRGYERMMAIRAGRPFGANVNYRDPNDPEWKQKKFAGHMVAAQTETARGVDLALGGDGKGFDVPVPQADDRETPKRAKREEAPALKQNPFTSAPTPAKTETPKVEEQKTVPAPAVVPPQAAAPVVAPAAVSAASVVTKSAVTPAVVSATERSEWNALAVRANGAKTVNELGEVVVGLAQTSDGGRLDPDFAALCLALSTHLASLGSLPADEQKKVYDGLRMSIWKLANSMGDPALSNHHDGLVGVSAEMQRELGSSALNGEGQATAKQLYVSAEALMRKIEK